MEDPLRNDVYDWTEGKTLSEVMAQAARFYSKQLAESLHRSNAVLTIEYGCLFDGCGYSFRRSGIPHVARTMREHLSTNHHIQ